MDEKTSIKNNAMKIHAKMKNLENKYIDLANFYKEGVMQRRE